MTLLTFSVVKIFTLSTASLILALIWCPVLTRYLYKHKLWKKEARSKAISGEEAPVFNSLHKDREVTVPRFGGLLIWVTAVLIIFIFYVVSLFFDGFWLGQFNFLSRGQTWLPLFTLVVASIVGLVDDILVVFGSSIKIFGKKILEFKGNYIGGGISFKRRLIIVILIGLIGGLWFYYKLGWSAIYIPLIGYITIGFWYVPLFIVVMLACWSGGVIDGLDGLAGGAFISIFGAFTIIALFQGKTDLACFCAVIFGSLLAFLWFNIPPARFYMGETGILGLTTTIAVIAFLTDSIIVLPIIAGLLVLESGSVIIQLLSKKIRKKKIFLCSPLHHHFEAIGWPSYKVTMRFWIIGIVLAIIGTAIRLLG
ncbi:hypothetical protein KJ786_02550 [Patescibacteria group bacterium]|nr:hypothetical protein [Patescibacteria group bacterium]